MSVPKYEEYQCFHICVYKCEGKWLHGKPGRWHTSMVFDTPDACKRTFDELAAGPGDVTVFALRWTALKGMEVVEYAIPVEFFERCQRNFAVVLGGTSAICRKAIDACVREYARALDV